MEASMINRISHWANTHPLIGFFLLAFTFSWIIQVPLALQKQELIHTHMPLSVHFLSAYGPMLAAIIMTELSAGRKGIKELIARITKWRVHYAHWLVAIAPLIILGIIEGANWITTGKGIGLASLGETDFLPDLGIAAVLFWIVTFGFGEEVGWRGFALPRLQQGRSALSATVILWAMWALWHLPLFFYSYELSLLPGFLFGLLAGAINFTWLYNSTGGSILLAAVFHGLFNSVTACSACKTGILAPLTSALVMVWAVLIVILFNPIDFSSLRFKHGLFEDSRGMLHRK
jgi:membrane protease YdiL (CAAX protease family)